MDIAKTWKTLPSLYGETINIWILAIKKHIHNFNYGIYNQFIKIMDYKIRILTNKNLADNLKNEFAGDLSADIKILEQEREPLLKVKLRARIWILKNDIKQKFQDVIELIKTGRIELKFGGGGVLDYESIYGFIANFFTMIVLPGIAWDLIKLTVKTSYKIIKDKKEYITIASTIRQPFDTLIRLEIPTNLNDNELDECLRVGEQIYKNIDEIRFYFGYFKIIIIYMGRSKWQIKLKNKK